MIYLLLADGFEDIEAVVPFDLLKRAKIEVEPIGIDGTRIKSSAGLEIISKTTIKEIEIEDKEMEGIILPGGMPGTKNLESNKDVIELIKYCNKKEKLIAAICAAPSIIGKLGMLDNIEATCYPGFEQHLKNAKISTNKVCVSRHFITSKGPGTAIDFSLAIIEYLKNKETKQAIAENIKFI